MERECKSCKQTMSVDNFYRYVNTRPYAKCKKCHNRTRSKYERKRDTTDRAPSSGMTTLVTQTPSGEMKYFAFDFINLACRALDAAQSQPLDIQTNVTPTNPEEVEVCSS